MVLQQAEYLRTYFAVTDRNVYNFIDNTKLAILFSYGKQSTAGMFIPAFSLSGAHFKESTATIVNNSEHD
jgi:hypothetical protein